MENTGYGQERLKNTKMTMANIIPHIEMKVKVIYSFKSVIYQGDGEIISYSETLDSPHLCLRV